MANETANEKILLAASIQMKELLTIMVQQYCKQWIDAGVPFEHFIKDYIGTTHHHLEIWVKPAKVTAAIPLMKLSVEKHLPDNTLYQSAILTISDAGMSNIYSTTVKLMREGKVALTSLDPLIYPLTPQEGWLKDKKPE